MIDLSLSLAIKDRADVDYNKIGECVNGRSVITTR